MPDTEAENIRLDGEIAASVKSLGDTIDTLFAQNTAMKDALEHALEKMWMYGFSENDLQPIRAALQSLKD